MSQELGDEQQVVRGGVGRGRVPVAQAVGRPSVAKQVAQVPADVARLDVPAPPSWETVAVGGPDQQGEAVADRHDALLVALAHDREAPAHEVAHDVAAVHLRDLETPQPTLRAQPKHEPFAFRGLAQGGEDDHIGARAGMRLWSLDGRQELARIGVGTAGHFEPSEVADAGVLRALARLRFPVLRGEVREQVVALHVSRIAFKRPRQCGHLASARADRVGGVARRLEGVEP